MDELCEQFSMGYGVASKEDRFSRDTLIALWPYENDGIIFRDLWKVILDIELPN